MKPISVVSVAACVLSGALVFASSGCGGSAPGARHDAGDLDSGRVEPRIDAPVGPMGSVDAGPGVDASTFDSSPGTDAPYDAAPADVALAPDVAAEAAATTLDLHSAIIFDNPTNLADWPVTTEITDVEFQYMGSDGVHVEFSKRDGSGSWPDVTPPGWGGPLEYTLGMAEYIGGQWYASAAIEFWRGLPAAGGNVGEDTVSLAQCTAFGEGSSCQVAKNWYYDGRWGNLAGYQPATGEIIGIFVVAGNLRGVTDGSQSPVQERSNVVLMPMPDFSGAKYTF